MTEAPVLSGHPIEAERAKASLLRAKRSLALNFRLIPEDRRDWSPAPTARTAIEIVLHSAISLEHIKEMFEGLLFEDPTTAIADARWRELETRFKDGDAALARFEAACDAYVPYYDGLTTERIENEILTMPFGLGHMCLAEALDVPFFHTATHIAQIEYLQTCLGDREWHF